MRPGQQQNKQRIRGRGRKGPNPLSRSYESNGPDVKIRGTAQHIAEKYVTLARDASASGDRVMAENYLQHSEHYGRIVAAAQGTFQLQRDEREIEYDEDGEEIFEDQGFNGPSQPDFQQPQPQMRDNRDGQRDGQRDAQPQQREGQQRDNQQRDGQQRDGQQRDAQQRDGQQRDGQPRDNQQRDRGNREGNRENRGERDGNREFSNRDGNREFSNRDGNREPRGDNPNRPRDFNRENRENRGHREPREGQADRAASASVPGGLGPQPFVGLPPAAVLPAEPQAQPVETAREDRPRRDEQTRGNEVMAPATAAVMSAAEDASVVEGASASAEPRRRGRPRRIRLEEREALAATSGSTDEAPAAATLEAPLADLPPAAPVKAEPAAAPAAEAPAPAEAACDEVKVKRRPGRPRKKKPEDEASEEGGDHMPAFLMASNG